MLTQGKTWKLLWLSAAFSLITLGCNTKDDSDDDDSSTTTTATQTQQTSQPATSSDDVVNIIGTLSLTSSSSSSSSDGLSLQDSGLSSYWLKCVILDLTSENVCIDQLDTDGKFDLSCDGFKGQPFGCFILEGTDSSDLAVVGMLTSSDLSMGEETDQAEMSITFDPSTGSASIESFEQTTDAGTAVANEVVLSQALKNFTIQDGVYGFCFKHEDNFDQGHHKVDETVTFHSCPGHTENLYVKYHDAREMTELRGEISLPEMELWKSVSDFLACHDDDGVLSYHISDGTRTYEFTEATASFDDLFDKIYNSGTDSWAPAAAVEAYQIALNDTASKEDEFKEMLEGAYGSDICVGLIDDMVAAYANATIVSDHGHQYCDGVVVSTGDATLDAELALEGPPPEWCVDYISAPADQKEGVKDRFLAECKGHVEGSAGESLWQKQGMVWEFLNAMAESRHQNGDDRFGALRVAFNRATELGLDLSADGIGDLSTTCDNGDQDDALADLALTWSEIDWNWERSEWTRRAVAGDGSLRCSSVEFDHHGNSQSFTNGRALLKQVLSSKFHQGEPETGIQQLNMQVCQESWDLDFSGISTTASYFTDIMDKIEEVEWDMSWKATVTTDAAKKTAINAFIDAVTGTDDGGPFVFGCTEVHLSEMSNRLNDSSLSGGGGNHELENFPRHIGWQLNDLKQKQALEGLNTSYNSGTDPLTALDPANDATAETLADTQLPAFATKMANLAIDYPQRYGWLLMDLCFMYDIGGLNLDEDLECGEAIPTALAEDLCMFMGPGPGGPGGGGDGCDLPEFDSTHADGIPSHHLLAELARRITEIKGRDAFHSDDDFQELKRDIVSSSSCLPDASLSHNPILNDDDELTFEITVRAPVSRKMRGVVNLDLRTGDADEDTSETKFIVEDSRIEKHEGGMGSEGCYWGEIKRLKNMSYTSDGPGHGVLKGTFTEAWVDTCRGANSDDAGDSEGGGDGEGDGGGGDNAWHQSFHATLNPESQL